MRQYGKLFLALRLKKHSALNQKFRKTGVSAFQKHKKSISEAQLIWIAANTIKHNKQLTNRTDPTTAQKL
jgi:hypothetical protein